MNLSPETLTEASRLLKAVANEKRLQILCSLMDGEKNVGELEKIVNLSQSALSQHLARLRRDKVVKTRRDAQTIYYAINCETTNQMVRAICTMVAKPASEGV